MCLKIKGPDSPFVYYFIIFLHYYFIYTSVILPDIAHAFKTAVFNIKVAFRPHESRPTAATVCRKHAMGHRDTVVNTGICIEIPRRRCAGPRPRLPLTGRVNRIVTAKIRIQLLDPPFICL